MSAIPESSAQGLSVLLDLAVKGTVLLAAAGLLALMLRRQSAALRHLVWLVALTGLLLMPVLVLVLPGLSVPLGATLPLQVATAGKAEVSAARPTQVKLPQPRPPASKAPVAALQTPLPAAETPVVMLPAEAVDRAEPLPWAAWVLIAWLGGAAAVAVYLAVGTVSVWAMVRRARRVEGGSWGALLEKLCRETGLARPVRLVASDQAIIPVAWGFVRPVVLIPRAAEGWPEGRRRVVLLHELAHVKRRDCLTQTLALAACVLYWFNPLAWLAARRLRIEREGACDDLVLAAGSSAADYAGHLLEIVRTLRSQRCPSLAAVAMARRSQFEGRMLAILDGTRNRRALTRWGALAAAILVAGIAVPLACLKATGGRPASAPGSPAAQPAAPAGGQQDAKANLMSWVEDFFSKNYRDITARQTLEWGEVQKEQNGNLSIRYKYLATIWDKDKLVIEEQYTFSPDGKFVSVKSLSKVPAGAAAVLPCGIKVELIGLAERDPLIWGVDPAHTGTWWQPDGSLQTRLPEGKAGHGWTYTPGMANLKSYKMLARLTWPEGVEKTVGERAWPRWFIDPPMDRAYDTTQHFTMGDPPEGNVELIGISIPDSVKTVAVSLSVPSGPWRTVAAMSLPDRKMTMPALGVEFPRITDDAAAGTTRCDLSTPRISDGKPWRFVAIDAEGKTHLMGHPVPSRGPTFQMSFDLPLARIKEVRFEVRPVQTVVFENVSLEAGRRTEVKAFVLVPAPEARPPVAAPAPGPAARNAAAPATQPGTQPAAPKAAAYEFGPVIERTVEETAHGKSAIDLDTGNLYSGPTPPKDITMDKKYPTVEYAKKVMEDWLKSTGVDAVGMVSSATHGLSGFDMVVGSAEKDGWNTFPKEFTKLLELCKPGTPAEMSGKGELPATYYFKTREGGMGVLQIIGFTDNPKGVKIRYKLVQQTAATPPSEAEKAAAPAGGQQDLKANLMNWVEDYFRHNNRYISARQTLEWGEVQKEQNGNLSIRYKFLATISIWDKELVVEEQYTFSPDGKFVSLTKLSQSVAPAAPPTAAKADAAGWSEGAQGLRARLVVPEKPLIAGEAGEVVVEVENASDKPLLWRYQDPLVSIAGAGAWGLPQRDRVELGKGARSATADEVSQEFPGIQHPDLTGNMPFPGFYRLEPGGRLRALVPAKIEKPGRYHVEAKLFRIQTGGGLARKDIMDCPPIDLPVVAAGQAAPPASVVTQAFSARLARLDNLIARYDVTERFFPPPEDLEKAVANEGLSVRVMETGTKESQRVFSYLGGNSRYDIHYTSIKRQVDPGPKFVEIMTECLTFGKERAENLGLDGNGRPWRALIRQRGPLPPPDIETALGMRTLRDADRLDANAIKAMTVEMAGDTQAILRRTDANKVTHEWVLDPKIGYAVVTYRIRVPPDGFVNQEMLMSDFRNVNGIALPYAASYRGIVNKRNDIETVTHTKTIKVSEYKLDDPNNKSECYRIAWPEGAVVTDELSGVHFLIRNGAMTRIGESTPKTTRDAPQAPAPASPESDAKPAKSEEQALSAILKLRGKVTRDEKLPGRPVVEVDLRRTDVTDEALREVKEFKSLQKLYLQATKTTDAGLKDLKDLKDLQVLWLTCLPITNAGLKDLKELTSLQSLDLYETQITDAGLKELRDLRNLRDLDIRNTRITDAGLNDLGALKSLQSLGLGGTGITDAGLKELKELNSLQFLGLSDTKITGDGLKVLKELKALQGINLEGTPIADAGLKELKEFKGLRSLNLAVTRITDAGLKEIRELRGLTRLRLGGNKVTDAGMKEIKELKALQELALDGTQVTDAGLKDLKELTGLQRLDLPSGVTDAGMKDLKELKDLRFLHFAVRGITNVGLEDLKELKNLQWLDLSGQGITDAGLKDLKELRSLRTLNLRNTRITQAGLADLKQALPSTEIRGP